MNETEYDIIDELYFVSSYQEIAGALNLPDKDLHWHLASLVKKGYVKVLYPDPETEIAFEEKAFNAHYQAYFYLATKAGLIAHNSR